MTVAIVDYGSGNLRSAAKALERASHEAGLRQDVVVTSAAEVVAAADRVVLPGVGAFGDCRRGLDALPGMAEALQEAVIAKGRPFLGICVGMQLLADSSDELGLQRGLGWMGGKVRKLQSKEPGIRIPHVGWNTVVFEEDFGEYRQGGQGDFYFDHSYAYRMPSKGQLLATCTHGETFCAAIRRDNLVAVQFHPEKSQTAGMRFLRGFLLI